MRRGRPGGALRGGVDLDRSGGHGAVLVAGAVDPHLVADSQVGEGDLGGARDLGVGVGGHGLLAAAGLDGECAAVVAEDLAVGATTVTGAVLGDDGQVVGGDGRAVLRALPADDDV